MLKTFQAELNSPFGYDDEFASYYESLTSRCVLQRPLTLYRAYPEQLRCLGLSFYFTASIHHFGYFGH